MAHERGEAPAESKKLDSIVAIVGIIATIIGIIDVIFGGSVNPKYISCSDWVPYTEADSIAMSKTGGSYLYEGPVEEAFAIRSFIDNPKNDPVRVENVCTNVISLKPIKEEKIYIWPIVKDHSLKIFALNDGWKDSVEHSMSVRYGISPETFIHPYSITRISKCSFCKDNFSLSSGDVLQIAEYSLIPNLFLNLHYETIYCCCYIDESPMYNSWFELTYDLSNDEYHIHFSDLGSGSYSVTLFGILDVDNPPDVIQYTSSESTPQVDNTYGFKTVIAPTKSCYVECKNVFQINGKEYETELIKVNVDVPVYRYTSHRMSYSKPMIEELAKSDNLTNYETNQILEKYRYHPNEILKGSD